MATHFFRVTATGQVAPGVQRTLMQVEVPASTKRQAIAQARREKLDYFGRYDYLPGTLRWQAEWVGMPAS